MYYYIRNPDDDLRQLEREYEATQDPSLLPRLQAARARIDGSGPIIPRLEWGYNAGLPPTAEVACGARAILSDRGADVVYTSRSGSPELFTWMAGYLDGGILHGMQEEVRRLIRRGDLEGNVSKEHLLATQEIDGQTIVVLGNTNASSGYLYLIAFIAPEDYLLPELPCEVCNGGHVELSSPSCSGCRNRMCYTCVGAECETCHTSICTNCNETAQCRDCSNFLCPSPQCQRAVRRYSCVGSCMGMVCGECAGPVSARQVREGAAPECEQCQEGAVEDEEQDEDEEDEEQDEDEENSDDED